MEDEERQRLLRSPNSTGDSAVHARDDVEGGDSAPGTVPKKKRSCFQAMQEAALKVKTEVFTLYYAIGDKRTGWRAKIVIVMVLGTALSPLDFTPELAPLALMMTDMLLLPLLLWLSLKLIPPEVMEEARWRAQGSLTSAAEAGSGGKGMPRLTPIKEHWRLALFVYFMWLGSIAAGIKMIEKSPWPGKESGLYRHRVLITLVAMGVFTFVCCALLAWRLYADARPRPPPSHTAGAASQNHVSSTAARAASDRHSSDTATVTPRRATSAVRESPIKDENRHHSNSSSPRRAVIAAGVHHANDIGSTRMSHSRDEGARGGSIGALAGHRVTGQAGAHGDLNGHAHGSGDVEYGATEHMPLLAGR